MSSFCGSANNFMLRTVGGLSDQMNNAIGGTIAPASHQRGGKKRRSRKGSVSRHASRRHKKQKHIKKSRRVNRRRK